MGFTKAELARREDEARPLIERLAAAGCRYVQLEMPDNNGHLRGKLVPLTSGLSAAGIGIGAVILTFKGGGYKSLAPPYLGGIEGGLPKIIALPDFSTAVALPWKRDVAAVICDYYLEDGSPCALSPRHLLRESEAALGKQGYSTLLALEYELYILTRNEALMREGRYAELIPFQYGGDVWSLSRSPSFEELAKEFMSRCDAAAIPVDAFHTETGRGMVEYSFSPQSALKAADDCARAKLYMRQLCAERGLAACFMTTRSIEPNDTFCGCHHNVSLRQGKDNAFWDVSRGELSQLAREAAAGILETMPAMNILYRPWVNSYRRNNHRVGAPENASWGKEHHYAAIRVVHGAAPERLTRFELRVPGADINPYLTITSILQGALKGIREHLTAPPFASGDILHERNGKKLPRTMPDAIQEFRQSAAAAAMLGPAFVEHWAVIKQEEWEDFAGAVPSADEAVGRGPITAWEFSRYFDFA